MSSLEFNVQGILFSEVNLFITDICITFAAGYCYLKLQTSQNNTSFLNHFSLFFLLTGIAAFISGFGHLLNLYTGVYLKLLGWVFSLLANYQILIGCVEMVFKERQKNPMKIILFLKLLLFFTLLIWFKHFMVISIDTILSIGFIALPIFFMQWKTNKQWSYGWVILGIVFTMLTGIVSHFNITLSENWFNAKDLNHLIICVGLMLMQKGFKQLQ